MVQALLIPDPEETVPRGSDVTVGSTEARLSAFRGGAGDGASMGCPVTDCWRSPALVSEDAPPEPVFPAQLVNTVARIPVTRAATTLRK